MTPIDQRERERALDPSRSFIVQAPAGSGKTELLIQRYLRLLGMVDRPESVVAITFTKKAAAEMQGRVLEALGKARGLAPGKEHEQQTWRLAQAVLEQDRRHGWNLAENPRRLAIRTIDSLCASLVRRMPWLSRLGPRLEPVEDASEHYLEAAQRTVDLLEDDPYGDFIEPLLQHVDNNQGRLVRLLADMLGRRDQWLRHVFADRAALRERIEEQLRGEIEGLLQGLRAAMPRIVEERLVELMRHAAANLADPDKQPDVFACADVQELPSPRAADMTYWRATAALLLTGKGEPRLPRGVNVRIGFHKDSELKPLMQETVDELADYPDFCESLADVPKLPDPRFDETQWAVLEALLETLRVAAAQLRLVFGERGQVDFAALTEAALRALGDDDSPTDLALALDGAVRHLLVDEFQDTSHSQMELLHRLTRDWTSGDGNTLFLVGDPMQSIYRFREAEVGLFLRTVKHGLPALEMEPLRLSVNFRSRRNIVDWVNRVFPDVFAQKEDIALGAVRFAASSCASEETAGPDVKVHPFFQPESEEDEDRSAAQEAAEIVRIVRAAQMDGKSVAILARSRTHLPPILAALRAASVRYSAIELDPLGSSSAVRDLLALTTALLHPGDRVSWLAVLRAPWCGLSLADLHELVSDKLKAAVEELLNDPGRVARLSPEGQARVARLREAFSASRPRTLRAWVEGVWLRLGGPATIAGEAGLDDAEAYFDLLEGLDQGCDVDLDRLRANVDRLFAAPDPAAGQSVQVMTIHKAKGLEFDTVILPGLGHVTKGDDEKLMLWLERPTADGLGMESPLLAPMKSAQVKSDAIYRYVQRLERRKGEHELARLLYVAATRARNELHLLGTAKVKDGEVRTPAKATLLSLLWPAVAGDFESAFELRPAPDAAPHKAHRPLRRLAAEWSVPVQSAAATVTVAEPEPEAAPRRYRWAAQRRKLVGTVVHDVLQEIGREGAQSWSPERVRAARPRYQAALRAAGVAPGDLSAAVEQVEQAILSALADERGRWILDAAHEDAQSEVSLAGLVDGRVVERRIDRTFVDGGVRWIVDFKTTPRKKGDIDALLRVQMERYRQQMEDYRELYRRMEDRPVRIGLYFPLLGEWREYEEAGVASV